MIFVTSMRDKIENNNAVVINTTSRDKRYGYLFSPFFLGPVKLHDGRISKNIENAWQFSKVYQEHDDNGKPNKLWHIWSAKGFNDKYAHRYPMGKNKKPLYSWDGCQLSYIEARKKMYIPFYANVLKETVQVKMIKYLSKIGNVYLRDFDGYNHREFGMSWDDVINCESKKMGHAFVLAMLAEEYI